MPPLFLALTFVLAVAQLVLPKRLAFLPILIGAYHLGDVEFMGELTPARLLILIGIARALATGGIPFSFRNRIDLLFVLFCIFAMASAPFHNPPLFNPYIERVGLILNVMGGYLYGKAYFVPSFNFQTFATSLAFIITPLALSMTVEKVFAVNNYYHLGAATPGATIRNGETRAKGPFNHAILGGTAGAVSAPFFFAIWKRRRKTAILGLISANAITIAANSSGPLSALLFSYLVIYAWKYRRYTKHTEKMIVASYIFFSLIMNRPVYYLMDSIDFTGGSTGWHRSRLIEQSITYLSEWWLAGTDYTRHWMPSGVSWNPDHTDLTNYYLNIGVLGGLPLMLTLIAIIYSCFRFARRHNAVADENEKETASYAVWTMGAALAAHVLSCVSVSYFDQMFVLLYVLIAMFSNLYPFNKDNLIQTNPNNQAA